MRFFIPYGHESMLGWLDKYLVKRFFRPSLTFFLSGNFESEREFHESLLPGSESRLPTHMNTGLVSIFVPSRLVLVFF